MLNNPVLKREFVTSLRTPRAITLGIMFLWGLGLLVVFLWPSEGVYSLAAQTSRTLFAMLSMGFLSLIVMCAPSFTATAIATEKERETWELLWDSLLKPYEIIFGKLAAGVGFALILIVCSLPMMGACSIGVSGKDVLMTYAIALVAATFYGMVGLYCSAVCRNSYRALIACYLSLTALCGLTWVPSILLGLWAESFHVIHFIRGLSPFAAMTSVVYPNRFASEHPIPAMGFGEFADSPYVFLLFGITGSLILLALTWRAVAKPPVKKRKDDIQLDQAQLKRRRLLFIFDPRKPRKMISDILNVIAVKEMRTKIFGKMTWFARAISACFIISLLLAFLPLTQINQGSTTTTATIALACISIPLAIIVLLCPVLTAGAISDEKESGIFDMLRVTRVSAFKIIMGKLQVAWMFTLMLLLAAIPTYFVLVYVSSDHEDMQNISTGLNTVIQGDFGTGMDALAKVKLTFLWRMLRAFGVMVTAMVFCTVTGVLASIFSRKTSTATAISYGGALFIAAGTLLPYFIAENLPGWFVRASLTLNPFAAAAKAVSKDTFTLLPDNLWMHNIMALGVISLILLAFSIILVRNMMKPSK